MKVTRRVVTGINAEGKSCVVSDGPTPGHFDFKVDVLDELWKVDSLPADLNPDGDPANVEKFILDPPRGGVRFRFFSGPPESQNVELTPDEAAYLTEHYVGVDDNPEDPWHSTETLDFIILLSGELILELEEDEVRLAPGDVVIQRGTRHAWRNPGNEPYLAASIMLSAHGSNVEP